MRWKNRLYICMWHLNQNYPQLYSFWQSLTLCFSPHGSFSLYATAFPRNVTECGLLVSHSRSIPRSGCSSLSDSPWVKSLEFKPLVPVITELRACAELSQSPSATHLSCRVKKSAAVLTLRVIVGFASHTDDRSLRLKTNVPDTDIN